MAETRISRASVATARHVEAIPGIVRSTLCWDEASMLCHFSMRAGSLIPQHSHPAAQNGYLIRGRIRFILREGGFEVGPGDGYLFAGQEPHGAEVLEDSEAIECFAPARPEYR